MDWSWATGPGFPVSLSSASSAAASRATTSRRCAPPIGCPSPPRAPSPSGCPTWPSCSRAPASSWTSSTSSAPMRPGRSASRKGAMPPKLGILAGGGPLPAQLIAACKASGRSLLVLAFKGGTDPAAVVDVEHAWIRVGAAGTGMELLRRAGCEELVLAGPVRRLSPASLRPDWRTLQFFAKIGRRAWGDDGLLSALIKELEGEGFRVIGAEAILPSLLAPLGPLGRIAADAARLADIARGLEVLRELGRLDIGQAAVVQQGVVLGLEAIEGTDLLIERCGKLQREGSGGALSNTQNPPHATPAP